VSTLAIVLIVLGVVIVLLAIGGYVVLGRRREAQRAALHARAQEADQHLARAHADDKGWERTGLEAAARAAFTQRHGREPAALMLVQVVDRPGTEDDEAIFDADGERLVLGRRGGEWVAAG
jgi:type II secretory pathway pseudopilin PulG